MAITRRGALIALLLLVVSAGVFIMFRTNDNRVVLRHHANGQALYAKEDYQGALRSYEQALERMIPSRVYAVSREQIEVDRNLARVRSLIAKAQEAMAEGKFAEATEAYQQGLQQWRPESNYGLTRQVVETSLREVRISLLMQDAEAAVAAGDLVTFARALNVAEELSPGDPRLAALRSARSQDIDGKKYWVQAARNLADFNLERAEASLQIAEFVLPSCENVVFARERLEALKAEERVCGQKPDYPLLYQALNSYLAPSDRSVHKILDFRSSSLPHEYKGVLYWVTRVEYEVKGKSGELARANQVAYIRQGKILHVREWDTGKMVFSTPGSTSGMQARPQSHIVMNLISRAFDINIMHWVGTLPTSDETIEVNGRTYSRVGDARFPTFADYEDYIRGTFIAPKAEEYLRLGPYVNVNGKIFVASGARGAGYQVDLYIMVVLESRDNYVRVELHIPSKWDDEDDQIAVVEFARQQDGRWLILSGNIAV